MCTPENFFNFGWLALQLKLRGWKGDPPRPTLSGKFSDNSLQLADTVATRNSAPCAPTVGQRRLGSRTTTPHFSILMVSGFYLGPGITNPFASANGTYTVTETVAAEPGSAGHTPSLFSTAHS